MAERRQINLPPIRKVLSDQFQQENVNKDRVNIPSIRQKLPEFFPNSALRQDLSRNNEAKPVYMVFHKNGYVYSESKAERRTRQNREAQRRSRWKKNMLKELKDKETIYEAEKNELDGLVSKRGGEELSNVIQGEKKLKLDDID